MMEKQAHNHLNDTTELLSAYIDNAVDITERRRVEALIKECDACAQELQELRLLRQWLQSLPEVQPRRSFKLDLATKEPRRLIFPTLRWATLAAAALLFVVLGIDTLDRVSPPGGSAVSIQQQAEPAAAPEASRPAVAAVPESADETEAVPESNRALAAKESSEDEAAPAAESSPGAKPTEEPMAAAATGAEEAPAADTPGADGGTIARGTQPSFDTLQREAEPAAVPSATPVNTLRIAVVILLLITVALGSGAVWAQHRHI